jgi:diaminohydroxyphosphoribosylaminopyrimidine deaminase/5-amino-6-(5-phosphoribosylamino)uracil reductase
MSDADILWMRRALALAEHGRGGVEPNPLVGAVVVRDDQVVGEGWHQRYGEAHAEVHALTAAGAPARGATLYVTLEPCCHHGKTPPCTDAILRAGVSRVVTAMLDPFPQVAGRGVELLRAAGIPVDIHVGEPEARRLNAPYLKLLATGRPYVHAKWAMTLDGKIATATGDSKWISNEASRRRVHNLRGRMDAILVGRGTVLADDPLLTPRPAGPRTPVRVVLSSTGALPVDCQVLRTARQSPVMVVTVGSLAQQRTQELCEAGCEVLPIGLADRVATIGRLLEELGRRRMTNVLVEGGSAVLGSFFAADAVDEVHVFLAPRIVGGAKALTPVGGNGAAKIAQGLVLSQWDIERVETDFYIHGWRAG